MIVLSELPEPVIRHLNGLWRRRWLVGGVIWLTALIGWFALWLAPDKYESRAQVFVQTETVLEPVLNGFTARPDYSQRVEVMRLQLLTRPNVEEIVIRSGLHRTIEGKTPLERRAKMQSLVEWVSQAIRIESPRDMYFIISYKHSDAETARAVVDAVVNLLIEQDLGASLSEDQAARRRLDRQIDQYEMKLTANENAVAEFKRSHAVELAASKGAVRQRELKESELSRIGDELNRMKGRILTLRNLISATPQTTSGDELDKLKVQLADLRSKYEESHPDIQGVRARIEQLSKDGGGALSSNPDFIRLQSELRFANESIGVLEARQERLKVELSDLDIAAGQAPAAEAALAQMVREYEQTQKTYQELLERRDRLELTKNLGPAGRGVEYQIFEHAEKALIPTDPPRALFIFAIALGAVVIGVGAGVGLSVLDKSYTQARELADAFGLPVLGAISEVASQTVMARRRRDRRRLAGAAAAFVAVGLAYFYFSALRLPFDDGAAKEALTQIDNTHKEFS